MYRKAYLALWAACFAMPAAAASLPLTLDEASRLAVTRQPLLAAQQARIDALRQEAVSEAQLPDPRLTVGLANLPVDTFSVSQDPMTQAVVGIQQMVPGGDKLHLRAERRRVAAAQTAADLEDMRRKVVRDASLAWLDLYYALRARALAQEVARELRRQVTGMQARQAVDRANLADVLAVKSAADTADDRVSQLTLDAGTARANLSRWIGSAAEQRELPPALPSFPGRVDYQELVSGLPHLPLVQAKDEAIASSRVELALARESLKPDWNIGVSYGARAGGRPGMVSVQVDVGLPLFPENRQDRLVASAAQEVERGQFQRDDQLKVLQAALAAAYSQWQTAGERISRYEALIMPGAKARTEAAMAAYQTGKSDFSAVLEARRAELELELQYLGQQVSRARAAVELRYLSSSKE